ncbi:hypothetical protein NIES37_33140 [Tolypothrix tenuis PCC 7101]|uniref:Uncharacterized protein n=1 Tax=Tolypothrix tenuis PCC 7101 TaxID=231146 RepID=A0A1Z4N0T4_9CYAN|nr:hypothetical protein NIES37_33140 [Tolypothrix tenuis PCC 7101]BAZ76745.1 hypothetical protein NIES50_53440 [Aulosira laxa NIES-50]
MFAEINTQKYGCRSSVIPVFSSNISTNPAFSIIILMVSFIILMSALALLMKPIAKSYIRKYKRYRLIKRRREQFYKELRYLMAER